ncbi:MAG: hypothetical protein ACLQME_13220 [Alphaproteobacteria bacterium]
MSAIEKMCGEPRRMRALRAYELNQVTAADGAPAYEDGPRLTRNFLRALGLRAVPADFPKPEGHQSRLRASMPEST